MVADGHLLPWPLVRRFILDSCPAGAVFTLDEVLSRLPAKFEQKELIATLVVARLTQSIAAEDGLL